MQAALRSLGTALVLGALVAAAFAIPVQAGAPERESFADTFEFAFAECDGFDILASGSFSGKDAFFTTNDGIVRIIEQFNVEWTMTRSDTGAIIGTGVGHSVLFAPIDGLQTSTWVGMRIIERYADGSVVREIGRIMFDGAGDPIFVAGPHPFGTTGVDRCEHVAP